MSIEPRNQRVHLSVQRWEKRMAEYFLQEAVEAAGRTNISVMVWHYHQLCVHSDGL